VSEGGQAAARPDGTRIARPLYAAKAQVDDRPVIIRTTREKNNSVPPCGREVRGQGPSDVARDLIESAETHTAVWKIGFDEQARAWTMHPDERRTRSGFFTQVDADCQEGSRLCGHYPKLSLTPIEPALGYSLFERKKRKQTRFWPEVGRQRSRPTKRTRQKRFSLP